MFIVRTWAERSGDEVQWRASVTHVVSGDRRYFTAYDELLQFLDQWRR
jgi:hypothetical protein